MKRVGVVGAGAWGTALAITARRANLDVVMWALEPEVVAAVNDRHVNDVYLPGVDLDPAIRGTSDLAEAAAVDLVLLVTPAQHLRATGAKLAPHWQSGVPAVICSKGVEQGTCALMAEVVADVLPGVPQLVLSGPTFAKEVAAGLPTAVTLAAADEDLGAQVLHALGTPTFRPYLSSDIVGAEMGGAVKNVLAIACGVVEGLGLGDNTRAAIITRGLAEIVRLAVAMGGKPETLMGLCGLGDLLLTATSMQSRNYSLGVALGEGKSLEDVLGERRSVTEGVFTAEAVVALAGRQGVDMPICRAMHGVLNEGEALDSAIQGLLNRPFREELDFAG